MNDLDDALATVHGFGTRLLNSKEATTLGRIAEAMAAVAPMEQEARAACWAIILQTLGMRTQRQCLQRLTQPMSPQNRDLKCRQIGRSAVAATIESMTARLIWLACQAVGE